MTPFAATPVSAGSVLVVDDDAGLREQLVAYLREHGYRTRGADSGVEMDAILAAELADVVVLDVVLPGEDGLSICRRLADADGPAIVMISAMGAEADRVVGLELGADDYLSKPCNPREVLARIRAVLRRHERARTPRRSRFYQFRGFVVDVQSRQVRVPGGAEAPLTAGEFALLAAFLEQPQRILSREALLEKVRGDTGGAIDRAVDVQVSRLRRKLHDAAEGEIIRTIRGAGYMFDAKVTRP
jgi:two-component system OmpR family response regulator